MANTATVVSLATQARARADQLLSTTFDDPTEVLPWVRDSLAQLWEQLVSQWDDWGLQVLPLSLIANQSVYSLPPDFRALQTVYALYNFGQTRVPLERYTTATSTFPCRGPLRYRVEYNNLRFETAPYTSFANCLELHYVPTYQPPLLDYSSIDLCLPRGWEEWVVLDVVMKMRLKLRLDCDYIIQQKQDVQSRIMRAAFRRDQTVSDVVDVYRMGPRFGFSSNLSGPAYWSV